MDDIQCIAMMRTPFYAQFQALGFVQLTLFHLDPIYLPQIHSNQPKSFSRYRPVVSTYSQKHNPEKKKTKQERNIKIQQMAEKNSTNSTIVQVVQVVHCVYNISIRLNKQKMWDVYI